MEEKIEIKPKKNNKKLYLSVFAVAAILLVVVLFFMFSRKAPTASQQNTGGLEEQELTMSPDEIGLTLVEDKVKKTVTIGVTKTIGITAIDYDLSYMTKGDLPRGGSGPLDLNKKPVIEEILLGTCSSGKCKYDEDVSNISLLLTVTKEDGKIYIVKKSLD